jgi:hypothetical protein
MAIPRGMPMAQASRHAARFATRNAVTVWPGGGAESAEDGVVAGAVVGGEHGGDDGIDDGDADEEGVDGEPEGARPVQVRGAGERRERERAREWSGATSW